ncbi:MAG: cytochrome C [Gammaproteobacteria bacterium]|nr:cytochrome C [Gammaproteobacteria bacterium]
MIPNHCGLATLVATLLFPPLATALTPAAEEGKLLYPACHVCHNPQMDPPLGPPMWGVKRRYQNGTLDERDFVVSMVEFVKNPSLERAIHDEAVAQMGLMPPMPLPDEMLEKIAAYIHEAEFPPPCDHWKIAVNRAIQRGDPGHAKKDQQMLERFCKA